jgi:alpha-1,3-rhamnosyltransferase
LIISDDFSKDNTVEICDKWLKENKDRFIDAKIIVPDRNTGIAPNCNRGVTASSGKWLKIVSGDDMLPPCSIKEFVDFVTENNCMICCCKLELFGDDNDLIQKNEKCYTAYYAIITKDLIYQKKTNLRGLFVPGPGLFFSRSLFDSINGFEAAYPFAEEWPFITKVLQSDIRIFFVNEYLYQYRIYSGSLCRDDLGPNIRVFNDMKKYFYEKGLFFLIKNGDILFAWHLYLDYLYRTFIYNSAEKKRFFLKNAKFILFFSPLFYIFQLKKIIKLLFGDDKC